MQAVTGPVEDRRPILFIVTRHCRSVRSSPAKHQSDSDTAAARPKAEPSSTASCMAVCRDGAANSRPASPAAAAAASKARPTAMPAMSGTERRKPNCAPDTVSEVRQLLLQPSAERSLGL